MVNSFAISGLGKLAARLAAAAVLVVTAAGFAAAACVQDAKELTYLMYRPASGVWYEQSDACSFSAVRLGEKGDVLVPADYDGDRIVDMATWNPISGLWTIRHSSSGKIETHYINATGSKQQMSNTPVPADYDGDGRADIAVWHAGSGEWTVAASTGGRRTVQLGGMGDVPVPADYDGDGRADLSVFRAVNNTWSIVESNSGKAVAIDVAASGVLAPADYTGDGKADIAFFNKGNWFIRDSGTGEIEVQNFGLESSMAVPADYDNDGIVDLAVYTDGKWFVLLSSGDGIVGMEIGNDGDIPVGLVQVVSAS
jgi:hypothetical protein